MNNNLPQVHKNSFCYKIKNFIINLFVKKEKVEDISKIDIKDEEVEKNIDFFKKYSYETEICKINKEKNTKATIMDVIENKPELLNTISLENLRNLTKLYDEIIEENKQKINLLKEKSSE